MQPQISPSGDLEIKCRFKALPHQRHFSDLEAMSMFYAAFAFILLCKYLSAISSLLKSLLNYRSDRTMFIYLNVYIITSTVFFLLCINYLQPYNL